MIRQGTVNDVRKISRLWLQMVAELAPGCAPNVEWWREGCLNALKSEAYHLFVIEEGGRIDGFLDFFVLREPLTGMAHALARHFYVVPELRNEAPARELYHVSMNEAKARGAQVIDLFCNENELAFWGKRGYRVQEFKMSKVL